MAIISISDSQINSADQILVADASSKIPAVDGSQITLMNATNIATGTIQVTAAGADTYFLKSNSGTPEWSNVIDGGTF